jgi:hypothetical protein
MTNSKQAGDTYKVNLGETQLPVKVLQAEIKNGFVWTMVRIGAGHPIEIYLTIQQAFAAGIIERA